MQKQELALAAGRGLQENTQQLARVELVGVVLAVPLFRRDALCEKFEHVRLFAHERGESWPQRDEVLQKGEGSVDTLRVLLIALVEAVEVEYH